MPSDPTTTTAPAPATPSGPVALGTVIVTGGASGLGRAVAARVAAAGGTPVVLDLAAPVDGGHEHEALALPAPAAAEAAVHRVAQRHGDLRGVVTAAGTDACGRLVDVPRDTWERVI